MAKNHDFKPIPYQSMSQAATAAPKPEAKSPVMTATPATSWWNAAPQNPGTQPKPQAAAKLPTPGQS